MTKHKYEDRIVAFIDILGFKNLVTRSELEPNLLERITNVLEEVQGHSSLQHSLQESGKNNDELKDMLAYSTFSDSILISTKYNSIGLLIITYIVAIICNKLFISGIFTRGAISYGKMIHRKNIALGQGLIKAYQIENSIAIYPRIIVDEELLNLPGVNRKEYLTRLKRDFDGLWYIHIFEVSIMTLNSFSKASHDGTKISKSIINFAKDEMQRSLEGNNDLSVRAKITWLANYFNAYALELGLDEIKVASRIFE